MCHSVLHSVSILIVAVHMPFFGGGGITWASGQTGHHVWQEMFCCVGRNVSYVNEYDVAKYEARRSCIMECFNCGFGIFATKVSLITFLCIISNVELDLFRDFVVLMGPKHVILLRL
jgi:hypothetical protein